MKIKQIMMGVTALMVWAASMATPSSAQNANSIITKGEKGEFRLIVGALGGHGGRLSADGLFVGSDASTETLDMGYVYDIARDTVKRVRTVRAIKSWDIYAGNDYVHRNGTDYPLKTPYTGSGDYGARVTVWSASANLDTIVTMGYEDVEDPREPGKRLTPNYAYFHSGYTGEIIGRVKPHWPMGTEGYLHLFGTRANAASNDATVLAGHGFRAGGNQNMSPVFWDLKADTSFFVGTDEDDYGSLTCVNNDGTLIGGSALGEGVIIHYDRENLIWEMEKLPASPGKKAILVQGISENGLVLYTQAQDALSSSESCIYNLHTGDMYTLAEYTRELYGLEMPARSLVPLSISDDGRRITGKSVYSANEVPYLLLLDENQIYAKPRQVTANQNQGGMTVLVAWNAPVRGQYTLKGYNVYRDSVRLNETLLDKDVTSFEHVGVTEGVYTYAVTAVYEEENGESAYNAAQSLMVIEEGGCLPVQMITSYLLYNRTAEIYWGLPSAKMSHAASSSLNAAEAVTAGSAMPVSETKADKGYQNRRLDLIDYRRFETRGWSSALLIDGLLYAAQYDNGTITVYHPDDMGVVKSKAIENVKAIYNMERVGDKLYLTMRTDEIIEVDVATLEVSNRIVKKGQTITHLSYIPSLNDNKGGFAYGDWTSMKYIDKVGRDLTSGVPAVDVQDLQILGTAYYKGKLYIFSGLASERFAELYTVDFETGQRVSVYDLNDIRPLSLLSNQAFSAAGLTLNTLADGTVALGAMLQYQLPNSYFAWLELESAPELQGYNLYRSKDGAEPEKVGFIQGLFHTEDLMEPGTYVYTVEPVSATCTGRILPGVKTTVIVEPIGECSAPKIVTAEERAKAVRLEWDYTQADDDPSIMGFDIYRNGELLESRYVYFDYTDFNLPKGTYTYRVRAFYANSCEASDSVKLAVTYEGKPMPPAHLTLESTETAAKHYDVTAAWDLPYFETPLAIGYAGPPYTGTTWNEAAPLYALIGWDSTLLEPYRDYYVVGFDYALGTEVISIDGLVYLNDTLVYQQPWKGRINEDAWNTILFNEYFPMDQPMEVCIGYKVVYKPEAKSVAIYDRGPAAKGFGGLISADGEHWTTLSALRINANWCIYALIVDKRDIEAAKKSGRPLDRSVIKRLSMETDGMPALKAPQPVSAAMAKSSSASVQLQGFNIYREGDKLNDELLTVCTYTDKAVAEGSYEYVVSAVYASGETEETGNVIDLGEVATEDEALAERLSVFPNPASGAFNVHGDYRSLEILNAAGTVVARYTDGRTEVRVDDLPHGLYVLHFTFADGRTYRQKMLLR